MRIIALAAMPFMLVLWLSVDKYLNASQEKSSLQRLELFIQYSEYNSQLLSALMLEKVLSYAHTESPGDEYQRQMDEQRKAVDTQLKAYREFIAKNDDEMRREPNFHKGVEAAIAKLDQYAEIRDLISKKILKQQEGEFTMRKLDAVVRTILDSMQQVVRLAAQNEELSLYVSAHYHLINAIEHTSTEAAIRLRVTNMDVQNDIGRFARLRQFVDLETDHLNTFKLLAPQKVLDTYTKDYEQTDIRKQIDEIRAAGRRVANFGKPPDVAPDRWFNLSQKRIRIFQELDRLMAEDIGHTLSRQLADVNTQIRTTVITIGIFTSLVIVLSFLIIRSIAEPLHQMVSSFKRLSSNKDMTFQLHSDSHDEISEVGTEFNHLMSSFRDTLAGVTEQTRQVASSTDQVHDAMHETTSRFQTQNQATSSVSVAINQMNLSITDVAQIASETSVVVQKANDNSVGSTESAKKSQTLMEELTNELVNAANLVERLNHESNEIGNVINLIQSIAEQTNLLALNAAIEAARAGDQGRGFAVVAGEVRNLASRTREATEQIQSQIEALQKESVETVKKMELLRDKNQLSIASVQESAALSSALKQELDTVTGLSIKIATAAEEQTAVAAEINSKVGLIQQDSNEMAHSVEKTKTASEALHDAANKLKEYVSIFKV